MGKGRVLYYLERWSSGGIEAFITNIILASQRSGDFSGADVVAHCVEESIFTAPLKSLGVRFFELTGSLRSPKNAKLFRKHIRENKYSAIHFNVFHGLGLKFVQIARKERVGVRIVHSHGSGLGEGIGQRIKLILSRIGVKLWLREATKLISCSRDAGKFLFGSRDFLVIPNGIASERFAFSPEKRNEIRAVLSLDGAVVFGHIGRFSAEKNHPFLLRTFAEIKKNLPEAKLIAVGEGDLFEETRALAGEMKIDGDVIFTGAVKTPEDYLSAMDVFLLPSFSEGFGIAAIEAQASGLPTLLSDGVPRTVAISDSTVFLPLSSAKEWADKAAELARIKSDRKDAYTAISKHGFDVSDTAKKIYSLYGE